MSETGKLLGGGAIADFRLVTEREQRFLAACRASSARDGKDLIDGEIRPLVSARRLRKRTVMADIAAKLGQRNEYLARIGDQRTVCCIAPFRRSPQQRLQIAIDERERFRASETTFFLRQA